MKKLGLAVVLIVALVIVFMPTRVNISQSGFLSMTALAAEEESVRQPWGNTTVIEESWGYLYTLENGDIVQVGDNTTEDFKAHVRTIRWNGVANFSMWLGNDSFTPTLTDDTVSFTYSNDIEVRIYPVSPCERLPEGGIEYDIRLTKKLAKPTVTFDIDWNNITWTKLLPLDEEYNQASAEEEWGIELAPFSINSTHIISDNTSEVLKTREMYEVNSYIGEVTQNWHTTSDIGNGITYSDVSRSYVHIHRGVMTDAEDMTAWVEDINIDEVEREITFDLPKDWLRAATYPVTQVCGVDPAYTEDMDNWVSDTYGDSDNTWSDYDLFTEKGVPKGAVAEIILTNLKTNTEENLGVRTDGSALNRYVQLHEAEGNGVTTCRMFAVCHSATGLIETYCADVSDDQVFYLVGYWENVGFTERWDDETPDSSGGWDEEALVDAGAASRVCHMLLRNQEADEGNTMGVRATDSALNRYVHNHEQEGGGENVLDMMVKADATPNVDFYTQDNANTVITNAGYFGSELDFVEGFSHEWTGAKNWTDEDATALIDQDGRVLDLLLIHDAEDDERLLGCRKNGSSAVRSFWEHEAEETGVGLNEYTGFGMSVETDIDGIFEIYLMGLACEGHFMGYFKPTVTGCSPNIGNLPISYDYGVVAESATPGTAINYFTVTNSSGGAVSITIQGTDMTGGTTWTLSDTATPGTNIYGLKCGLDDDDDNFDIIVKKNTPYNDLVSGLADSGTQDWGLQFLAPSSMDDGAEKTCTVTVTATCD